MSSQPSTPALTPNAHFHRLIEDGLNGTGKESDLAEIILTVLQEPFLQKSNFTAANILKLYRHAHKAKAKNEIAVALLACLSAKKTIQQPLNNPGFSFGESYLGTKQIPTNILLEEIVRDAELHLSHRTEALTVIACRENEKTNRFYGVEKSNYDLISYYSKAVYNENYKQRPNEKIVDAQKKTFDAIELGITKALLSKDFQDPEDGNYVAWLLENPIQYACDKSIRDQAINLSYRYIESKVPKLKSKKDKLVSLAENALFDYPKESPEQIWFQNRVILLEKEITLDDQNSSFWYETTYYEGRNSYTIGDYQKRIDAKQAILDKLRTSTNSFFEKQEEFQQQPVPALFQS